MDEKRWQDLWKTIVGKRVEKSFFGREYFYTVENIFMLSRTVFSDRDYFLQSRTFFYNREYLFPVENIFSTIENFFTLHNFYAPNFCCDSESDGTTWRRKRRFKSI